MVKNDGDFLGFSYIAWGICALMNGALFLTSLSYENKWSFLFNTAIFLALAISTFVQARRWKPMNKRRQLAAVSGFAAHVPLAAAHPLPNVAALPLPFTIMLRPGWPKFVIGLSTLAALGIYLDTYNYRVHGIHLINIMNPFAIDINIIPLFIWGLLIALWLAPQRIEITQEGMTIRHAIGRILRERIRWSEARLFAVRDGKPGEPAIRYELSSPYEVVKWRRLRHPRWWSLYRPAIPFAEYDAQMEALIALISGITGLPLYDVR